MLTRIQIENFKSFRKVELELGTMNLFVGPNASGKSNFFDSLRVLQGVGNGYSVSEILDGKPRSATNEMWEGIRGGGAKACFEGRRRRATFSITIHGRLPTRRRTWEYAVAMRPDRGWIEQESLTVGRDLIYESKAPESDNPVHAVRYLTGRQGRPPELAFERSRPALRQFEESDKASPKHASLAAEIAEQLADMQRIDPSPVVLRGYSQAPLVRRMGERGENFAALIGRICLNDDEKASYLEWLRELRPQEVDDVATLHGAVGEPMFVLRERGRKFPAPVLSDGTLRFAAVAAAFFQPDMPGIMTIEEIENGVHASRARLLVELVRAKAGRATQVMATTHSPLVLAWLERDEYAHTYYCRRDPDTGAASITPLSRLPHLERAIAGHSIGDLFAEGWMESAL